MIVSPAFILSGSVFLSASHPAIFSKQQSTLWFSKNDLVKLRESSDSLILEAQQKGFAYAHGLESSAKSPLKIIVLSDKNWEALQKCPQAKIRWDDEYGVVEDFRVFDELKKCPFDELALQDTDKLRLEKNLKFRESQLISLGLNMIRTSWKNGRRSIEVLKSNWESLAPQIRLTLGEYFPIYQWKFVESAVPGRTLLFEITLFEFSQHRARELGLEWPQRLPILSLQGQLPTRNSNPNSLIAYADFGESQGVGKIVAQPQLRCKPGEKAIFQNGGELPISQLSSYHSKTEWKAYGLKLEIEPSADLITGASEISLAFSLEVSEPDLSSALNGIPGMSKKNLQSRFDLRNNETTLLSTLLQKRESKARSGLAFLTQIPLLSYLFSNEGQQSHQSELWIAIKSSWEEAQVKNPDDYKVSYEL